MVATTSGFSPALLVGQSQSQIASEVAEPLADPAPAPIPAPPTGAAIVAVGQLADAGICRATGQQPAAVCTSKGVRGADAALGLGLRAARRGDPLDVRGPTPGPGPGQPTRRSASCLRSISFRPPQIPWGSWMRMA